MQKIDLNRVRMIITDHCADQHRKRCLKQSLKKVPIETNKDKLLTQISNNHYKEDVLLKRKRYLLEWLRTPKGKTNRHENDTFLSNGTSILVCRLERNQLVAVTAYPTNKRE